MRIAAVLFGLVIATAAVLVAVAWSGAEAPIQMTVHPDHPTLLQSADGATRVAPVWVAGAVLGALQIAFFSGCFLLGMQRRGATRGLLRSTLIGMALYQVAFVLMLVSYRSFVQDPSGAPVLGFPAPTALMLYLVWPIPFVFLWIYLREFDRWVPDEAEIERLRELASDRARRIGPS